MAIAIQQLVAQHFRCLHNVEIRPCAGLNFLCGDNGAGKSSLLEAIHCLGLGRGFHRQRAHNLVQLHQDSALLRAELNDSGRLGWQRQRTGELRLRYNQTDLNSVSELLGLLPVQLINAESFLLLEGSPAIRRQFIDWGVFHVEHSFLTHWQSCQTFLRNRNQLLKSSQLDSSLLLVYSQQLALAAEQIDRQRQQWFDLFAPVFQQQLQLLLPDIAGDFTLAYRRGWDKHRQLLDQLQANVVRERKLGSTQYGPQRADLQLRFRQELVEEVLSRGQQKLVVLALKLAQILLLQQQQQSCVVLIDDLAAELDQHHQLHVLRLLSQLSLQTFITAINKPLYVDDSEWSSTTDTAVFHVEQGRIANNVV